MFGIVKTPKPGTCAARRCKATPYANLPEQDGLELCHRHHSEWIEAGSPDLTSPPDTGATELVPAQLEPEKRAELVQAEQAVDWVKGLPVDTQEQIDQVTEVQSQCKARAKELEAERTKITKPINEALRHVNGLFKPLISAYDSCARAANGRLLAAQAQAQALQDQALQEIEAQGGHVDETTLVAAHDSHQVTLPPGVGREILDVEVTDESQLPREVMSFDRKKALTLAKQAEEMGVTIPGMRYFRKPTGV